MPRNIYFLEGKMSQIAISEESMNCFIEQVSKSSVGDIYLNLDQFNKMFRVDYDELTTSSLA